MSAYVLQRIEDGKYVTPPGQKHSYSDKLQDARVFTTRANADAERCGNERIIER